MSERRKRNGRAKERLGLSAMAALLAEVERMSEGERWDFTDLDEPGAASWWQWLKR